jgi:hypothetical protein
MNDYGSDVIAQLLKDVLRKLDALIRLHVTQMGEGKNRSEQMWIFSVAGLAPREIATILGTSSNAVRVALSNLRKTKRPHRAQRGEFK